MKQIISIILTLAMGIVCLSACGMGNDVDLMQGITPNAHEDAQLSQVDNTAVADFAVRLFHAGLSSEENTLISPLSVLVAVSMTANGAESETLSQMEAVLGMPIAELNAWIRTYTEQLPESEKYKLSLANGIWFKDHDSFTVNEAFLQTNADYYGAGIYAAPFDASTCREINDWVEEKTDGMIKDILDDIPESAVMYLVNALAFDAEWQNIYEKNQIRTSIFTTEDGEQREVEMMYADENRYLEDDSASGFIKYYRDGKYAFVALLPNEGISVADYAASLTGSHLQELLGGAQYVTVETALPKFESEYSTDMREILREMGMVDAFDEHNADFSGLGYSIDGNLFISRVLHKTYIAVDGKGTRAGAATVVEVDGERGAAEPDNLRRVYLDRPFVYMLIDCQTNLPFFMGTVMDTGK